MNTSLRNFFVFQLLTILVCFSAVLAVPASPVAEGWGSRTRHAYESDSTPDIYRINDLDCATGTPTSSAETGWTDYTDATLGDCLADSDAICLFEVSGVTDCGSGLYTHSASRQRIAGSTSPFPGVAIKGAYFTEEGDDNYYSHLRFWGPENTNQDTFRILGSGDRNILLKNMTFLWGEDEVFSMTVAGGGGELRYVTLQDVLVAEPINSGAPYCMLIDGNSSVKSKYISVIDSVLAHCNQRTPKTRTIWGEWINNTTYNIGHKTSPAYTFNLGDSSSYVQYLDYLGNYVKLGPNSITTAWGLHSNTSPSTSSRIYVDGNIIHTHECESGSGTSGCEGRKKEHDSGDEWDVVNGTKLPEGTYASVSNTLGSSANATSDSGGNYTDPSYQVNPNTAYAAVLSKAGAWPAYRHTTEARILNEVETGIGTYKECVTGCTSEAEASTPTLTANTRALTLMADPHGDSDADGYTNLEECLHDYDAYARDGGSEPTCLGGSGTPSTNYSCSDGACVEDGGGSYSEASCNSECVTGFPTFGAVQASTDLANASSHTVTMPTPIAAGDVITCAVNFDGGSTTYTWDTGGDVGTFTELESDLNEHRTVILYRIADGTEDAVDVTVTTGDGQEMAAYCWVVENWHGTTPPEISCSNTDTDSPNPPSLNPTGWPSEKTLWVAVAHADLVGLNSTDYPSSYDSNRYSVLTVGSGGVGQAIASRNVEAESEDPGAFTFTASDGTIACTLAYRPAVPAYECSGVACILQSGGSYAADDCDDDCDPVTTYDCIDGDCTLASGATGEYLNALCDSDCILPTLRNKGSSMCSFEFSGFNLCQ